MTAKHDDAVKPPKRRSRLRPLLRMLIYPWGLYFLSAVGPRYLRARHPGLLARVMTLALQAVLYMSVGLPVTILITGEVLIGLNEAVIAEQANYRLQSDFAVGLPAVRLALPGPRTSPSEAPPREDREAYHQHLVERYSPVLAHKVSQNPQWDIPVDLAFDGNGDPRDNVANGAKTRPLVATVYGELTAETEDSFYFTYSLYHIKDYDHPIRERLTRWSYHDNDNEGLHLRVDKQSMAVVEVETWFHNRFLLFNLTGETMGSEPIHGRIYLEDDTHVLIYAQPQGHGVRCIQQVDLEGLFKRLKIMRFRGERPAVHTQIDGSVQVDVTYELKNFDAWYALARGPFLDEDPSSDGMFEGRIELGVAQDGTIRTIGRYIAGKDYYIGGWSRPKPMWSWDDGWDDIPIFIWHFFPSISFYSHGGQPLSHVYVYNRPCDKVFGESAQDVLSSLQLNIQLRDTDKWSPLRARGGRLEHELYWELVEKKLKAYVNYLFHALG